MNFSEHLEDQITQEMKDQYTQRTFKHISLVQKYCGILGVKGIPGIIQRGYQHDLSKLEEPELTPYIFVNWKYRCKDTGDNFSCSKAMEERMTAATEHHIKTNSHHPEFHSDQVEHLINKYDRDAAIDKAIDASKMTDLDIAEMVCDWCGMSEERDNSPREWADKMVGKRWTFTPEQVKTIYDLIDYCWSHK
jgi:hypothetical protein